MFSRWDQDTAPPWDATARGSSLEDKRPLDELETEIDKARGRAVIEVLYDLSSFFRHGPEGGAVPRSH